MPSWVRGLKSEFPLTRGLALLIMALPSIPFDIFHKLFLLWIFFLQIKPVEEKQVHAKMENQKSKVVFWRLI